MSESVEHYEELFDKVYAVERDRFLNQMIKNQPTASLAQFEMIFQRDCIPSMIIPEVMREFVNEAGNFTSYVEEAKNIGKVIRLAESKNFGHRDRDNDYYQVAFGAILQVVRQPDFKEDSRFSNLCIALLKKMPKSLGLSDKDLPLRSSLELFCTFKEKAISRQKNEGDPIDETIRHKF